MANSFNHRKVHIDDWIIDVEISGEGPALLLLHGFPETKLAWDKIVPQLISHNTIVLPDIPGYGDSTGPAPNRDYSNYSKRSMGNVLNQLMKEIGFDAYAVAGHDRGGRIAYRMAFDHPKETTRLAVLNIIPTLEVAERIDYDKAYNMENWFFLSQPAPFPETLINTNPEFYLNFILDRWSGNPALVSAGSRKEYLKHFKKHEVIKGMCAEYRAMKWDIEYDRKDRENHNQISCPMLVLWSENDFPANADSPLEIWRDWAKNIQGKSLACGHFLMEERPTEVIDDFIGFFGSGKKH